MKKKKYICKATAVLMGIVLIMCFSSTEPPHPGKDAIVIVRNKTEIIEFVNEDLL